MLNDVVKIALVKAGIMDEDITALNDFGAVLLDIENSKLITNVFIDQCVGFSCKIFADDLYKINII